MSEDRFKEIKLAYPAPCEFPAIDWLISEVERLQVELGGQLGAYLMVVDENTALREALRKYGSHILDYSGTAGCRVGITDLEEQCRCGFREALAPAQEDKDVRQTPN